MNLNEDLYKEIILDHYKSKKNRKRLAEAKHLEAANPSCGDDIDLYLEVKDGRIEDAAFEGMGCSICLASADMMCDAFRGKSVEEAKTLIDKFKGMLTRNEEPAFTDEAADLEAMQGVAKFPLRIKCALLAWTTANQIVNDDVHPGKEDRS